ncbi:histidine kinase [Neorhizobium lilium]|uniref:Histidine kinase n=1 Tax=Neorhizobium lilium TaxID=2503024 RepID=A0A3S3VG02_9HYPH|nr:histidine kinase [Neorhizobium lilium]RWX75754.1 histidine kinase [Neorhizobium lilium]
MKNIFAAAALATMLAPTLSFAETLKFPSDAPIAQITIPDAWGPEETETGIQATSDDSAIYLSIDVADAKTSDKVVSDAVDFLQKNGITIDEKTQKESEDSVNGMQMSNLDWDGKDKDGPVSIGLSFVQPRADKLLVITYWGTKGEQEKHAKELMALINSLKPVK